MSFLQIWTLHILQRMYWPAITTSWPSHRPTLHFSVTSPPQARKTRVWGMGICVVALFDYFYIPYLGAVNTGQFFMKPTPAAITFARAWKSVSETMTQLGTAAQGGMVQISDKFRVCSSLCSCYWHHRNVSNVSFTKRLTTENKK